MSSSTRARGEAEKSKRRATLLAAAARRFDAVGFDATTMAEVADAAGLAKGTTYLYFPSKESLFLKLLAVEVLEWSGEARDRLGALRSHSTHAVAKALAGTLARRPRLLQLLALQHPVLERNADGDSVLAFRRSLIHHLSPLAALLEQRLADLRSGEGMRLLERLRALTVGLRPPGEAPAPVRAAIAAEPQLAALEVDFERELADCLTALVDGWR
jgi:AcrR family transcriptional regulator